MEPEPRSVLGVLMSDLKCEASKGTLRIPDCRQRVCLFIVLFS